MCLNTPLLRLVYVWQSFHNFVRKRKESDVKCM
jgi:hypothetical protein